MGFKVPDKSTIDHSLHGFTDVTCQCNRTITGKNCWILSRILMLIPFHQSEGFDLKYLYVFIMRILKNVLIVDSVFHLVLRKYHPTTLLYRRA